MPPSSSFILPTDPTSRPVLPSANPFAGPSTSFALDPSLAALSKPLSSFSPSAPSAGHPSPKSALQSHQNLDSQAVAGPGPSSLAYNATLFDLQVDGGEAAGGYPYAGERGGEEFVLPTPPVEFEAGGGGAVRKGKGRGKGKKVTIREGDIAVEAAAEEEKEDGRFSALEKGKGKAKGKKRARSPSYGASSHGEDDDEQVEGDDDDASGSDAASPGPSSSRQKPRSSSATQRRTDGRHKRSKTLASKLADAGGIANVAGKRMKVKGVKAVRKKGVVLPLLPELFRGRGLDGEGEREGSGVDEEKVKQEIARAKDPFVFLLPAVSPLYGRRR